MNEQELKKVVRDTVQSLKEAEAKGLSPKCLNESDILLGELFQVINSVFENNAQQITTAREKAEMAERAKAEFYDNISHEIRIPLNTILGYSHLLSDSMLGQKQERYLELIKENTTMLSTLLNDTLDVSKLGSNENHQQEIDFNLENLMEGILKVFQPRLKGKDVDFYFDMEGNAPKDFSGNPTLIRQLLLNLISHSIRLTEEGESSLYVGLEQGTRKIHKMRISLRNSGMIIGDQTIVKKSGTMELGLYFIRRICDELGAEFKVIPRDTLGTELVVVFELKQSEPVAKSDVTPLPFKELKEKKVLLVDVDENSTTIVRRFCEEAGMLVLHQASLAEEALEWLYRKGNTPHLILADVILPDMNGYVFASKIRESFIFQSTKLVNITSVAKPGAAQKAKHAGFDGYLPKPFKKNEFYGVIQTTLGDNRPSGQIITRHFSEELCFKGLNVLVAEDDPSHAKMIQKKLEGLGCIVDCAGNGKLALQQIKKKTFDVCLLDEDMPVLDGRATAKEIRRNFSGSIPIIGMLLAESENRQACKQSGMNDFVLKPIDLSKLKDKFHLWVNR